MNCYKVKSDYDEELTYRVIMPMETKKSEVYECEESPNSPCLETPPCVRTFSPIEEVVGDCSGGIYDLIQ